MDNIYIITYVVLIFISYTWTMHYEYPSQEGEYDEELIEDSDEMFHDKSYGVEAHNDYFSHQGSNHDGSNDEKPVGEVHDYQHLKNNHDTILDGKGIETKAEHVLHKDRSNEDISKTKHDEHSHANQEHLVESEHDVFSDQRQIEADDKHLLLQGGVNKHPIYMAHDENNHDEHDIFSDGKHIEAYEKQFPDELETLKHTTEIAHDENSIGTYDIISVGGKVNAHEKYFLDQREDNKYTTQIALYENRNGEYGIISSRRKIEAHENHFLDQQGTNRHTTQIAHGENKDGNEECPNRLEHDVVVGGIEAHEEHVPNRSRSTEHTTQILHIGFLDDSEKHLDKGHNSAFPVESRIQIHGQHIINQDDKDRNVLKTEHNECSNTGEDQFFNKREHGIIIGGNKTEIPHLLVVEIKDLKKAKPLEHTDGNEGNINDHEVVLDGSGMETRNNHATNIALNREDSKESIKVEDFDKKGEDLRERLHNTTSSVNTDNLKKREYAEFSPESKDSKNISEHAAVIKNKLSINEKIYNFSNYPVRYEPDYFGFYDYYDLLSQVAALKVTNHHLKLTHKTESPSVNFGQKSLNIKEEITSPGTTLTPFPSFSLSPITHSSTKYYRLNLTSNSDHRTFHTEKTTQRAKLYSVTPQSTYSYSNYLKETHRTELTSMFSKNSENNKVKNAPLLTTSSQFLSTSSSPMSHGITELVKAITHQNALYQTVPHRNNIHQSKKTQNIKINTRSFTNEYATSNYLKKRFKTLSTSDSNDPVSYKMKATSPISITTEFHTSSSSSLNSQNASTHFRGLHLLPYLHLHQTKNTQKSKIRTTISPLSTLKPMLSYVIMCKTVNATKFDSQPLVFRRRSNPVHKFSFIQRSFPKKKKKLVSTPQPPTISLKVQKVEIGPRDYTVCAYHHYTIKSSLYQVRKSTTRLPLRMKVDNFRLNSPHLTMIKSEFLTSPLFFQKSETYKGYFSNKATEAYSSFTPEPSYSSTIQLPSSNIHMHKLSTSNSFKFQDRYISKHFPTNIKTTSSSNHYTVSPYNRKNTLKLHDIHKTIFSNARQKYLSTKLYIPYVFKQRITSSSSTVSSIQYEQKSNIPKFSPRLYTSILAMKNGNPIITFPSYVKRRPTKSTPLDSIFKTTSKRNPNNLKFSSRMYTANFSTAQNDNTTTKLPSYIGRHSTKSTSLNFIYPTTHKQNRNNTTFSSKMFFINLPKARNNYLTTTVSSYITRQTTKSTPLYSTYKTTYNKNPKSSKVSSRLYTTNLLTTQNDNTTTRFLSYVTRQPTKSTSLDSIYKTTYKQNPNKSNFSTTNISRRRKGYSRSKFFNYITQSIKLTSLDSVYKTTDAQIHNLISKYSLSTERSNQLSTKSLGHHTNSVPSTSPSSKPETVLENPEFYKIALSKEVSAVGKLNYSSTKLSLIDRLYLTMERKKLKLNLKENIRPEFTTENQNKTLPTQQSGGYLNHRRRRRPGRGSGRTSGSKRRS